MESSPSLDFENTPYYAGANLKIYSLVCEIQGRDAQSAVDLLFEHLQINQDISPVWHFSENHTLHAS